MRLDEADNFRLWTRQQWILLIVLGLLAAVSLGRGCLNALATSNDFQWSGSHLLLQHIDPWHQYLLGDPGHLLIKVQIPNYLPLLYVMLAPLGVLPFSTAKVLWLLLNIFFGVGGTIRCGRFYGLRAFGCTVLVLLLLISTSLRNSLGLGQQSLLILFLWTLALCPTPRLRNAVTLGLSYAKYSFAPPAFLYLLVEMGPLAALLSTLPALASFLMAYLWLGGPLRPSAIYAVFISPVKVASDGYFGAPGPNLMDLTEYFLKAHHAPFWLNILGAYVVPIALAGVLIWHVSRQKERLHRPARIALLAVLSVAIFKHHGYDHVLLIFPAALALRHWQLRSSRLVLALLCLPWYAERLLDPLGSLVAFNTLNFAALTLMGVLIYRASAPLTAPAHASLEIP